MAKLESVKTSASVRTIRSAQSLPVIESTLCGYVDIPTVQELSVQLDVAFKVPHPPFVFWLVDAIGVTGFSPRIVQPAGRAFRSFREQGGRHLVLAASLSNVRMIVRALGLAAQVRVEAFQDFAAAQSALRQDLAAFRR